MLASAARSDPVMMLPRQLEKFAVCHDLPAVDTPYEYLGEGIFCGGNLDRIFHIDHFVAADQICAVLSLLDLERESACLCAEVDIYESVGDMFVSRMMVVAGEYYAQ